jgi:hypothetical protein
MLYLPVTHFQTPSPCYFIVINSYIGCPAYLQRRSNVISYTDTCLELVDKEHSWKGARRHCKKYGGDLVETKY